MQRNSRETPETQVRNRSQSFVQALDTFYTPARDRRGEVAMQRGFTSIGQLMAEKAAEAKNEQREDFYDQGVADAIREEAGEELKGVKTGTLFRQHSKYYTMGLNEQRGKAAGLRFKTDMMAQYAEWDGKNSDDPNDFRNWMAGKTAEFIAANESNPELLNAALPVIAEVQNNTAVQHTTYTNQRLQEEQFTAFGEIVGAHFSAFADGVHTEEELYELLKGETDELYDMEGGAAKDALVGSAITWAETYDNLQSLEALALMHDKGVIKLNPEQKLQLSNAADALEAQIARKASGRSAADKAAREALEKQTKNGYYEALDENPAIDPRDYLESIGLGDDEELFRKLMTTRETFDKAEDLGELEPGEVMLNYEIEIMAAGDDLERRAEILKKYAGPLGKDVVNREWKKLRALENGEGAFGSDQFKKRKKSYLDSLGVIEDDGIVNFDKTGRIRVRATALYEEYSLELGSGVDPSDTAALRELHTQVIDAVNEDLLSEFPELAEKVRQNPSAAATTSLGDDVAKADTKAQAEQVKLLQEQAAAAAAQEAAQAPTEIDPNEAAAAAREGGLFQSPLLEGVMNFFGGDENESVMDQRPDPVNLTAQDTPYADAESDTQYDEVREGFYGELIKSFTDGVDNRPTIRSAEKVFEEDPEFADGVKRLAAKYDVDPMALVAVMNFETGGTFSTSVRNAAGSGATGLIQFMPRTAASLGTTTDALAKMTRGQQLKYVEKYFDQFGSLVKGADVDDFYMAVLYPKAIGKADGFALFTNPSKAYTQNRGLDTNNDGRVTKFEAASKVRKLYYS